MHSPIEEPLGYFQVWAIISDAAINIHVPGFARPKFPTRYYKYLTVDPVLKLFDLVRNCQTVFSSSL